MVSLSGGDVEAAWDRGRRSAARWQHAKGPGRDRDDYFVAPAQDRGYELRGGS